MNIILLRGQKHVSVLKMAYPPHDDMVGSEESCERSRAIRHAPMFVAWKQLSKGDEEFLPRPGLRLKQLARTLLCGYLILHFGPFDEFCGASRMFSCKTRSCPIHGLSSASPRQTQSLSGESTPPPSSVHTVMFHTLTPTSDGKLIL